MNVDKNGYRKAVPRRQPRPWRAGLPGGKNYDTQRTLDALDLLPVAGCRDSEMQKPALAVSYLAPLAAVGFTHLNDCVRV
jgi:hypothetical protein